MTKNLTMDDIMKIVQEEMDLVNGNGQRYGVPGNWVQKLQELAPEGGHADPVEALQAIAADLDEAANAMDSAPSHVSASEFGSFIRSKSQELQQALDKLLSGVE